MTQPGSSITSYIPPVATGSYPPRAGNLVRSLIDGEAAFRRIGEAIEAAQHSVYVTVAWIAGDFRMPDGRGSLFDVLNRAAARGLDVRALFWRHNFETASYVPEIFSGTADEREMLRARGARFRIRWDRAEGAHCHHQKSWVIDAGEISETSFVGGINLNPHSVVAPGHAGGGRQNHDVYVEIAGPSATDIHHNFVQRWNEANDRALPDGTWGHTGDDALAFPHRASAPCGESLVQIQRTIHLGRYTDDHAAPDAVSFDVANGEHSILDQYLAAIDAARSSIYIENQAFLSPRVIAALDAALTRGVDVVALVPAEAEGNMRRARAQVSFAGYFDQIAALARHPHFALVGIMGRDADGGRFPVFVHDKIMLIDDRWATIGSCNLRDISFLGNTEMNASIWDATVVRTLRRDLLAEHLGEDTASLEDRAAFALYRRIARENAMRHASGNPDWQGLAFTLDAAGYGV